MHETKAGVKSTRKVKITLTIQVVHVGYFNALDNQPALEVRGRTIEKNDYVDLGVYHTF